MDEARASWNTIYQSKDGFECQITLRDEDEVKLAERAEKVMASIKKSEGIPLKRRSYIPEENVNSTEEENRSEIKSEKRGKTYVDENGVRRCNQMLKNGKVCGQPVIERQGKYGPFWSCPNYKQHTSYKKTE